MIVGEVSPGNVRIRGLSTSHPGLHVQNTDAEK